MTNKELVLEVLKMAGYDSPVEKENGGITYHKDRWGYVLGGQGELYTEELAKKWTNARRSGKTAAYFLKSAKQWYSPPRRIVDCSGLIVQAIRTVIPGYADRSANTFKAQFTKSGGIRDIPETAGLAVWKDGHIGVYLGYGKVCESRGVAYGVVISDLKTQKWTHYGKLKDVEYDDTYVVFSKKSAHVTYQVYTVKKGDTLWGIAKRYKTTVDALAKLNDLKNPSLIFAGQRIRIREEK
ncbi:MAG: LysM peptidoglycan-binding domain-containing protein [Bacillota bacterium]|jgi:LysM repeat protein